MLQRIALKHWKIFTKTTTTFLRVGTVGINGPTAMVTKTYKKRNIDTLSITTAEHDRQLGFHRDYFYSQIFQGTVWQSVSLFAVGQSIPNAGRTNHDQCD